MPSPNSPAHDVTVQADVALPEILTIDAIESLVGYVLDSEGVQQAWQLGIHFVSDETMQRAHAEFMDIDAPTDIMTFPYDDDDGFTTAAEDVALGGDLMISVDRAAAQAIEGDWDTAHELMFLVTHGVLHLVGWDDLTESNREAMLDHQTDLMTGWIQTYPSWSSPTDTTQTSH